MIAQALAFRRRLQAALPAFCLPLYQGAVEEVEVSDLHETPDGPVLVTTWLYTYTDGQTDTLQRRTPVARTGPGQYQLPGHVHPVKVRFHVV
jgi:hypothetical protein